jgi:hypothetical protein
VTAEGRSGPHWIVWSAEIGRRASTLRGWLDEQRLISEENLRILIAAKGLAEEEIQLWAQTAFRWVCRGVGDIVDQR